jgi:hypothetical protein
MATKLGSSVEARELDVGIGSSNPIRNCTVHHVWFLALNQYSKGFTTLKRCQIQSPIFEDQLLSYHIKKHWGLDARRTWLQLIRTLVHIRRLAVSVFAGLDPSALVCEESYVEQQQPRWAASLQVGCILPRAKFQPDTRLAASTKPLVV